MLLVLPTASEKMKGYNPLDFNVGGSDEGDMLGCQGRCHSTGNLFVPLQGDLLSSELLPPWRSVAGGGSTVFATGKQWWRGIAHSAGRVTTKWFAN